MKDIERQISHGLSYVEMKTKQQQKSSSLNYVFPLHWHLLSQWSDQPFIRRSSKLFCVLCCAKFFRHVRLFRSPAYTESQSFTSRYDCMKIPETIKNLPSLMHHYSLFSWFPESNNPIQESNPCFCLLSQFHETMNGLDDVVYFRVTIAESPGRTFFPLLLWMSKLVVPNLRDESFSKNVTGWLGFIVRDTVIITILFFCFVFVCLVAQSYLNLCNALGCSPPGSSGQEVSQARILEWVVISSFSRVSSWPRDQTWISGPPALHLGSLSAKPSDKSYSFVWEPIYTYYERNSDIYWSVFQITDTILWSDAIIDSLIMCMIRLK